MQQYYYNNRKLNFDSSWKALVAPGMASEYFEREEIESFDVNTNQFSLINAWWLSELSRLMYRKDPLETQGLCSNERNKIMNRVGLKEIEFFYMPKVQAAFIVSEKKADSPFGVIVFRGTRGTLDNWINNFKAFPCEWFQGGKIHVGFKKRFLEIWDKIESSISSVSFPLYYTGHSLGGALATIAATIIPPKAVYTFGSPRVGNDKFKNLLKNIPIFRISTPKDIVTNLPPSSFPFDYVHVGKQYSLNYYRKAFNKLYKYELLNQSSKNNISNLLEKYFINFFQICRKAPNFLADHAPINYSLGLNEL